MSEPKPRPPNPNLAGPDLEERLAVRGRQRGDRYVRIVRPAQREFERKDAGHLVATEHVLAPTTAPGRFVDSIRRVLFGEAGMVRHWWKLRRTERGWRWRAALSGLGAVATAIVALVVGAAKFGLGAWMVLVLIPALIALMWAINHQHRSVEDALALDKPQIALPRRASPRVLVLLARLDRASLEALAYARSIAPLVTAVHVTDDPAEGVSIRARWRSLELDGDTDLVILESPFRALIPPLVAYIDALQKQEPERSITIVLSEFVPRHPWEYLLHNQAALRLKLRLFFRPNTVVIDVPYHV